MSENPLEMSVDFSDVSGFQPFDAQRVAAECVKATAGVSNAGAPKVDVQWKVSEPEAIANRRVFDTVSFHENALPYTKEQLKGLGLGDFKGNVQELAEMLLGHDVVIAVGVKESEQIDPNTNEPYPPRNVASRYYPAGAPLETGAPSVGELD